MVRHISPGWVGVGGFPTATSGDVMLSKRQREAGLPCETSSCRDNLAPPGHRRDAERTVRLS
jgi:hypothetical protein